MQLLPLADDRVLALLEALETHGEAVRYIKLALHRGDRKDAVEAWYSLPEQAQIDLWVAPTKGGPFTTLERKQIRGHEDQRRRHR